MSTVVVAANEADAQAVEAVKNHHAHLAGALAVHVESLVEAAARNDLPAAGQSASELVRWCQAELIPHALAEERVMYPPAHELPRAALLVDAMLAEHRDIVALVKAIARPAAPVRAAASAEALRSLFTSHLVKENEQILPLLAASNTLSLADILDGMHELLGGHEPAEAVAASADADADADAECGCGGECGCGHQHRDAVLTELDARTVPHALRHATILRALDSVRTGSALVLVAPHDPLPLLAQLEERSPALFTVDYLQRGPQSWRIRFIRA